MSVVLVWVVLVQLPYKIDHLMAKICRFPDSLEQKTWYRFAVQK